MALGNNVRGAKVNVSYTSKTVVLSRAAVRQDLVGVSANGTTFTFAHASGALAHVRSGSVLLLDGTDVAVVKHVAHSGRHLIVRTGPVTLPNLVHSGQISFKATPNFGAGFVTAGAGQASAGSAGPGAALDATAPEPLSISGNVKGFGYALGFTPAGSTINFTGTFCYGLVIVKGNCGAPEGGLAANVIVKGSIDLGSAKFDAHVSGGLVSQSSFTATNVKSTLKLQYVISRGETSKVKADPPVVRFPVSFQVPFVVGGIPVFLKLEAAIIIKLGLSAKNSIMRGGVNLSLNGSDTVDQSGHTITSSGTDQVHGSILDALTAGLETITPVASGSVIAVQMPKIGLGIGYGYANVLSYLDLVTSLGQTSGSLAAGMDCSSYDLDFSVGGGLEAQAGPIFTLKTPRHKIYDKQFTTTEPGCPVP